MTLAPGARLGPYEVVALIGAGGMGEVYRARDTRLSRDVAIKVCRGDFARRFEGEARVIAQLNHPNICTLHDVGSDYLVMELMVGETLAEYMKKGALPVEEVVRFGSQIADALTAAHGRGIVHRDLKPGNVMRTKSGVKVLDFGLAKTFANDETQTMANVVVGTPAYMAPEQRRGGESDARTDIYALGLMMAEMATGKRTPVGEKPVLDGLPPAVAHVVERCLSEDPDLRWQTARDVKAELEWAGKVRATPVARSPGGNWILAVAALAIAGSCMMAYVVFRRQPVAAPLASQFSLEFPQSGENSAEPGRNAMPAPSPDGRYLLIDGNDARGTPMLWLRPTDSEATHALAGTEGASSGGFWSLDGEWIGFFAGGKLKKVRRGGGGLQTIATLTGLQEASWGARGDILIRRTNREPLYRISAADGSVTQVTHLEAARTENSHRFPSFLSDGRRYLFTARCAERQNNSLYLGSLDTGKVKRLMRIDSQAKYLPGKNGSAGLLVYYLEGALVSRGFDADREEVLGEPSPVYQGLTYAPASLSAFFTISADGRVVVIRRGGAGQNQLTWFDRAGEPAGTLGPEGDFMQPRISPDGSRVAVAGADPQTGNRDVFVMEVARGTTSRITTNVANDWYPVWSPDGKQLLFGSDRQGGTELATYLKQSLEASAEETRYPGRDPSDWSRDGRWIVFGTEDLRIAEAVADAKPLVYLATRFRESTGRFSPNGQWLAYCSDEGGQFNVYARPFTGGPAPTDGKIQISPDGGDFPVWRRDGGELYYMDGRGVIFAVDTTSLGKNAGVPHATRLFRACPGTITQPQPMRAASYGETFDTQDGKRFLVTCAAEPPGRYTVLMNWVFRSL